MILVEIMKLFSSVLKIKEQFKEMCLVVELRRGGL